MLRLSITPKFTLIFVLFGLLLLVGLSVPAYLISRSALRDAAVAELLATSIEKQAAFTDWIADKERVIGALAQHPHLDETIAAFQAAAPDTAEERAAHAAVMGELAAWVGPGSDFLALEVIDAQSGRVLVATDPGEAGKYREAQPFFLDGLHGTSVQNPLYDLTLQRSVMQAAAPILGVDGQPRAVLAGLLDLAEIDAIIQRRTGLRRSDDAYLLDGARLLIARPHLLADATVLQVGLRSAAIDRCLAHNSGVLEAPDYRDVPAIIVFRWLPERQLCLVTKLDQQEAYAAAGELGLALAASGGAVLLLGSVLAFGLSLTLVRPIKQLAEVARAFGRGELERRAPRTAADEVGDLNEEFNKMAAALAAETTQLRRRSEQTFLLSVDLIGVADFDGFLRTVNPSWRQSLGYNEEELLGAPWIELIHPEDRPALRELIARLTTGSAVATFENRCRSQDGAHRWIQWNAASVAEDRLIYTIGHDVTADKQAMSAVRESEARFRAIFEQSPIGKSLTAPDGAVLQVNQAFANMLGYTIPEMEGVAIASLTHAEDLAETQECGRIMLAGERDNCRMEKRYVHRSGKPVWCDVSTRLLRYEDGRPRYFITTIMDISARKEADAALHTANAELARSNAELERFAYVASHDLQEPLRMITSYMQLVERRYKGKLDADADEFIGYAVDGANRMKALINDLLTYSRIGTRGKPFAPTDLEEVLAHVCNNLAMAIAETGAVITHDPLPTVLADDNQMMQLLQNLVNNALKFRNSAPPAVHLTAARSGNEWIFQVRDNGIGIEASYFDRIFVVFQRLHTTADYPGTGIGLSVCKKIVERHGGRIWVESTPGAGSIFYFTLPASDF